MQRPGASPESFSLKQQHACGKIKTFFFLFINQNLLYTEALLCKRHISQAGLFVKDAVNVSAASLCKSRDKTVYSQRFRTILITV